MSNKLIVDTAHSRYVIDHETATFTRTTVHEDANDLSYSGVECSEPQIFEKVSLPPIGERMTVIMPDGSWIHTTPIVSITPEGDEAA